MSRRAVTVTDDTRRRVAELAANAQLAERELYGTIATLIADRELTVAAAASVLGVSEATVNRALAAHRRR